jgi:hypothetical protein
MSDEMEREQIAHQSLGMYKCPKFILLEASYNNRDITEVNYA